MMVGKQQLGNYRITGGTPGSVTERNSPDLTSFLQQLDSLQNDSGLHDLRSSFFDPEADLVIARAPGRLDVMGGIADYSGSLVLELPIAEGTLVALQRDSSRTLRLLSLGRDAQHDSFFELPLADLQAAGSLIGYDTARQYFSINEERRWAAYVAGVFLVLMRERGFTFPDGARILISSRVPEGKGVSSSAALEVATMSAVVAAFSLDVKPRDLALLCQTVENLVVGAPCGVMDQMTSVCGDTNQLLELICQPAEICGSITLPEDLALWGLDSGVRHSVSGADYGSVRVGTFIGYRMIAELAGLKAEPAGETVKIDDSRWKGYLANLTVSEFEELYRHRLPEEIGGAEFLTRYEGTTDPVTRVQPERTYAVRLPTVHAVYENFRVRMFAELLRSQGACTSEERGRLMGELMYQSHASYSACGLGSAGTDTLVELVKAESKDHGLYGAKITGGGSGGTVAVLGRPTAEKSIATVARRYAEETGHEVYIFRGSSPGSAVFGHLLAQRTG